MGKYWQGPGKKSRGRGVSKELEASVTMSESELGRCTRERQVLEFSSRITLALQAKDVAPHGSCSGVCMSAGVRWGQDRGKRKSFVNWKRVIKTCIISAQIHQNRIFRAHFFGEGNE